MTKQEEVYLILREVSIGALTEQEALVKLQELGVVIKVIQEYPNLPHFIYEPLIKEDE